MLLDLPAEIRCSIWGFCQPGMIGISFCDSHSENEICSDSDPCFTAANILAVSSILLVNRLLRREAHIIVRQRVTLHFKGTDCIPAILLSMSYRQQGFVIQVSITEPLETTLALCLEQGYSNIVRACLEMWYSEFKMMQPGIHNPSSVDASKSLVPWKASVA